MRRKRKKVGTISIMILFCFTLVFMSTGYSLLEQKLSLIATASIKQQINNNDMYDFNYNTNLWGSDVITYQFNPAVLTYLGDNITYGWKIVIEVPNDTVLGNCWSCICVYGDSKLYISNDNHNGSLLKGDNASFGFEISTKLPNYELNVERVNFFTSSNPHPGEEMLDDGIDVSVIRTGGWGNITALNVDINNNTGYNLNFWEVGLRKSDIGEVSSLWGASYIETDELIILTGALFDPGFVLGGSINVGMQISSFSNNFSLIPEFVHGRAITSN